MFVLDVHGMSCGGCVSSVTKAVQRLDPHARVAIDLASGRVEIEGQITPEKAITAIDGAGFDAKAR